MQWLSSCFHCVMISQSVKGMAIKAPTEEESKTIPNVPLSIENISCMRGNRAAKLACTKPLMKNISLTAMRGGESWVSTDYYNYKIDSLKKDSKILLHV